MSLLLSPVPKNPKYIFPSSGDIDFDPDLTRDSFSFLNETDHSQEQLKDLTKVLPEDLQALEAPTPELSPQPSVVIQRKQYTTQEKILQVQNGQYISNSLKGNRSFPQEILQTAENIKQSVQENYKKNDDGALEMINEVQLKKQKKVLGFLVKQFGSALFTGKPIVSVSLPVTIFEPQSNLEREASGLGYAPYYLEKGGNTTDTLEQFKLAATQFIASLHLGTNPQKPFNPILGETFQGKIGDSPVYLEQISHHPPASALQMLGKNFTLEGMTEFSAAISMNSVKSWKVGYLKVNYKNTGAVVRAQYPPGLMNGTAFGKRTFQFTDKFYIFDIENKYYTEISFDGNESSLFKRKSKGSKDQFSGVIWKINDSFAEKLRQATKQQNEIAEIKFKEREHSVARLGNIEGSWLEFLKIDGQVYWSFGSVLPYKLQYLENPLPSDSNFRLDVLYMRAEDEVKSQNYKEILEENQRNDRKLREHNRKRHLK